MLSCCDGLLQSEHTSKVYQALSKFQVF